MSISIVILTFNQRDITLRCLRSLVGFTDNSNGNEIILVDNGSSDGTIEAVERNYPDVKIIRLPENRGVAAGRNVGLSRSNGDFLMILDNDTIASPAAIKALAHFLQRHPEVGIVAPRLTFADGRIQRSFRPFPGIRSKIMNLLSSHSGDVPHGQAEQASEPF